MHPSPSSRSNLVRKTSQTAKPVKPDPRGLLSKSRHVPDLDEAPYATLARALAALRPNDDLILEQTKKLEDLNRRFDVALNNMGRGLSMFDAEARLIVCNQLYREIYGLPEELTRPGTTLAEIVRFHVKTETGRDDPEELERQRDWIEHHVAELARGKSFSHTQFLKSGRIILVSNQPLDGGGWVDLQEDVTEKRQAEQKIDWLARHDTLTEIANRHHFREQLENWFGVQHTASGFALHWIDLDHFKEVNDTFGHPVGDALLKSVAKRLRGALRDSDIVAWLGGDEFAILQAGAGQAQATKLAKRLMRALAESHIVLGHRVISGASIGIALAPKDGSNPEELMKNADLALYSAKSSGRCTYAYFRPEADSGTSPQAGKRSSVGALGRTVGTSLPTHRGLETEDRDQFRGPDALASSEARHNRTG
jgi:diguanylate cyclase (GGDEF)-like protein